MTKKNHEAAQRRNKHKIELRDVKSDDLKAFGLKKAKQLQFGKNSSFKISKSRSQINQVSKKHLKVQKELFEKIVDQSEFQCPVCLELMIEPTLLQCGHAYCFKCIQQLMIYKSSCGVCRNMQNEPQFQRSKHLQTLIEKVILPKSQNYLDFYCRLADTQNWKKVRNASVNELGKGSFIDFRDKDLKWRKAEITKMTFDQQNNLYLMDVKYKKQGQSIEETISSDSGRYAKFSYYTRMKYLEAKPCCMVMENSTNEEVLLTPFTSSFRDLADGLEDIFVDLENETPSQQHQENILLESSMLPELRFEQNWFLNQIFHTEERQPIEFIELLA